MSTSRSEGRATVYLRYGFAALVRSKIPTRGCATTWDKQGAAWTHTPDGSGDILKCPDRTVGIICVTKRSKWHHSIMPIDRRDTPWVLASLKQAPPPWKKIKSLSVSPGMTSCKRLVGFSQREDTMERRIHKHYSSWPGRRTRTPRCWRCSDFGRLKSMTLSWTRPNSWSLCLGLNRRDDASSSLKRWPSFSCPPQCLELQRYWNRAPCRAKDSCPPLSDIGLESLGKSWIFLWHLGPGHFVAAANSLSPGSPDAKADNRRSARCAPEGMAAIRSYEGSVRSTWTLPAKGFGFRVCPKRSIRQAFSLDKISLTTHGFCFPKDLSF